MLALDLGSKLGFAATIGGALTTGVVNLKPSRNDSDGMRMLRFDRWLTAYIADYNIKVICYELVYRHNGVYAAHIYGGLQGVLQKICEERGVNYVGVGVGEIKKFIAGSGNASKDMVLSAVCEKGFAVTDHNEADAIALLLLCQDRLVKGEL